MQQNYIICQQIALREPAKSVNNKAKTVDDNKKIQFIVFLETFH